MTEEKKQQIKKIEINAIFNQALENYLEKNYDLAFQKFSKIYAETQSPESAFWLAKCNQLGHGTKTNYAEANKYLKILVAGNDKTLKSIAAYQLSINYRLARGLVEQEEKNQHEAFAEKLLKQSAKNGYDQAQYEAGARCLFGIGTKQDSALAIRYLTRAADRRDNKNKELSYLIPGHAKAQELLGWCYKHGVGVNHVNAKKAIAFIVSASLKQNAKALYRIDESVYDSAFEQEVAKFEQELTHNTETNESKPSFY